jgi:plastocyanin
MKKILIIFTTIIVLMIVSLGCGASITNKSTSTPQSKAKQGTVNVTITNFNFSPQTVNVNKGDTVVWKNTDAVGHNVIGKGFSSQTLKNGETFSFTFNASGTFDYVCSFHSGMKGQVVVK